MLKSKLEPYDSRLLQAHTGQFEGNHLPSNDVMQDIPFKLCDSSLLEISQN